MARQFQASYADSDPRILLVSQKIQFFWLVFVLLQHICPIVAKKIGVNLLLES